MQNKKKTRRVRSREGVRVRGSIGIGIGLGGSIGLGIGLCVILFEKHPPSPHRKKNLKKSTS